jgi:ATP-binding cassette subfamily B protein
VSRPGPVRAAVALATRAARAQALALTLVTVAVGGLPAVSAWLGKLLFDELAAGGDRVVRYAAGAAAAGALATIAATVGAYLSAVVRARISVAVDDRLVSAVGGLRGLEELEDPAFLDRLRLATQAAHEAPGALVLLAQEAIRTTLTVLSFGGALLVVYPPMVLVLLVALVPAVLSHLALSRLRTRAAEVIAATQRRHEQYRFLATDLRAAKETRVFGLAGLFHARMMAGLRAAVGTELAVQRRTTATSAGLTVLTSAVAAGAMVLAATRALDGSLTIGDVTLFAAAVAAIQAAVVDLVGDVGVAVSALRLFRHYLSIVDTTDRLGASSAAVPPLREGIELRDVWFRYPGGDWVLRGVDLRIPCGSAVGLVGVNGSGKSTLVKLLCRLYEPSRGVILWDGQDIRSFDIAALRARVGVTFQDYMSYDLSAAENIGIGDLPRLDDRAAIRAAATLSDVDAGLSALPRGYDTLLSRAFYDEEEGTGSSLSGGQWQRVALARSLVRDADLLILDEPSAGLDAAAEHRVHETLRRHRSGRTSLLISHRLSVLRDADEIVVLRDGTVTERGRHGELLAGDGDYARLFTLQASGYLAEEPA